MVKIKITVEIRDNRGGPIRKASGVFLLPPHGLFHITRRAVEELAGTVFGCATLATSCGGDVHEDRKV